MHTEEFRDLALPDYKKAIDAVREGEFDKAFSLISGFKEMTVRMHDALMDMVGLLLTYIAENYGEDELEKALRFRHTTFSQVHGDLSRMGIEQLLGIYSLLWRGHNSKFSIIEEKDRVIVKQEFCGSGTRMRKRGSTDPHMHLGYTKGKHKWCWDKKGVSYYCAHCCMIGIMSVEQTGRRYPICFVEYADNVDDPCFWYFYKDEKSIPKKLLQQIGL